MSPEPVEPSQRVRAAVAVVGRFLLAGLACVANVTRCGRRHCYFTGPLFLLAAVHNALKGFYLVPMNETRFLGGAGGNRRREIIRGLVDRIEIGRTSVLVVFRISDGIALSSKNPVFVTFSRC